jgi:hypothetical protein
MTGLSLKPRKARKRLLRNPWLFLKNPRPDPCWRSLPCPGAESDQPFETACHFVISFFFLAVSA